MAGIRAHCQLQAVVPEGHLLLRNLVQVPEASRRSQPDNLACVHAVAVCAHDTACRARQGGSRLEGAGVASLPPCMAAALAKYLQLAQDDPRSLCLQMFHRLYRLPRSPRLRIVIPWQEAALLRIRTGFTLRRP